MRKCVFFDRDGIVNRSPGPDRYVKDWSEFELLPEFVDVLRVVRERGYDAVIATNQRGVARGMVSLEALHDIHRRLRARLAREHGLELLDVFFCPHEEGACDCRKPRPGMLTAAAARHGIDLGASWMVGDDERDVEAGRRAGCRTIRVAPAGVATAADFRADDLAALRALLAGLP
ncbi:MAG: HAD-IIIA family hydrolase [Lentisphaerae bacterium]|nr:HAD-IIIA family hydrolase [Lentisphaerota bacterium]